ncbi:esterase [Streptomyces parvus]|uniref:alpha/beta fold hydrolase n=1 Tax=Streptomyces parvus TaxID=66428 RepID=UPI00142F0EC0|nr:alpha/beta hydrolase family protein [Streptomyces parvus]GGS49136.1 esterase [Streptomyces parvus]
MTVFVLVHGAWTGAYVWRGVREPLRQAGHEVFAPSLTGLGERVHLARPGIDVETHVQDVLNLLRYEDLDRVALVGHSYGGVVAQVAAVRAPHRVAHLVLLDALLARDGRSVQSLRRHPDPGGDWIAPPRLQGTDPARLARLLPVARLSLQPAATFREPLSLPMAVEEGPFTRTYVRAAARTPSSAYAAAARTARTHPAWSYHELEAGHDMMPDHAPDVARLLGSVATVGDRGGRTAGGAGGPAPSQ